MESRTESTSGREFTIRRAVGASVVHTSPYRKRAGQPRLQNPSAHSRRKCKKFVKNDQEVTRNMYPLSRTTDRRLGGSAKNLARVHNRNSSTGTDAHVSTVEPITRGIRGHFQKCLLKQCDTYIGNPRKLATPGRQSIRILTLRNVHVFGAVWIRNNRTEEAAM